MTVILSRILEYLQSFIKLEKNYFKTVNILNGKINCTMEFGYYCPDIIKKLSLERKFPKGAVVIFADSQIEILLDPETLTFNDSKVVIKNWKNVSVYDLENLYLSNAFAFRGYANIDLRLNLAESVKIFYCDVFLIDNLYIFYKGKTIDWIPAKSVNMVDLLEELSSFIEDKRKYYEVNNLIACQKS